MCHSPPSFFLQTAVSAAWVLLEVLPRSHLLRLVLDSLLLGRPPYWRVVLCIVLSAVDRGGAEKSSNVPRVPPQLIIQAGRVFASCLLLLSPPDKGNRKFSASPDLNKVDSHFFLVSRLLW